MPPSTYEDLIALIAERVGVDGDVQQCLFRALGWHGTTSDGDDFAHGQFLASDPFDDETLLIMALDFAVAEVNDLVEFDLAPPEPDPLAYEEAIKSLAAQMSIAAEVEVAVVHAAGHRRARGDPMDEVDELLADELDEAIAMSGEAGGEFEAEYCARTSRPDLLPLAFAHQNPTLTGPLPAWLVPSLSPEEFDVRASERAEHIEAVMSTAGSGWPGCMAEAAAAGWAIAADGEALTMGQLVALGLGVIPRSLDPDPHDVALSALNSVADIGIPVHLSDMNERFISFEMLRCRLIMDPGLWKPFRISLS